MKKKICTRCVMDITVPDIEFFPDGRCSCCKHYDEVCTLDIHSGEQEKQKVSSLINRIKIECVDDSYDCIIGLSGGVDSSYVAYLVKKQFGLRVLAVHLDNGWNTELAVSNVEKLVTMLGIDLVTHVLEWNEFRDIQKAFLKSGISNIEIPTDHAIWAVLLRTAAKHKIKYIFAGNNVVTESLMPPSWLYGSKDSALIRDIHRKFGDLPMKSYPYLTVFDYFYYLIFRRIRWIPILNYIEYNKAKAKSILIDELGWRDYGGKHYESIFTRFFHARYLIEKFGFDLRKAYFSALICSGQMTREQALDELELPPASQDICASDLSYVLKKLGLNENEYRALLAEKPKTFSDYKNDDRLWKRSSRIVTWARKRVTRID